MPSARSEEAHEDTDALLRRAGAGDGSAISLLLDRHRGRLKRMMTVRIDDRLAARVDPSDVVQEALIEAAGRLPLYAAERPLPFYPWLRRLAMRRMTRLLRTHIDAARRAVEREAEYAPLPDRSAWQLAERIVASETGPNGHALRAERRRAVHDALAALSEPDREVLVLRYLEQLTNSDIAAVLGLSISAVKMRHLRALQRMQSVLGGDFGENQ